jgi:hypothetical protein
LGTAGSRHGQSQQRGRVIEIASKEWWEGCFEDVCPGPVFMIHASCRICFALQDINAFLLT